MKNNLKLLREARKLSQKEFADLLGMHKNNISAFEIGVRSPRLATAYTIAKILNVEVTAIWPNTVEVIEETVIIRRVKKGDK